MLPGPNCVKELSSNVMSRRKVYIQLENSTESIWVEVSDDHFILLNVPFFASGLSFGDLICANCSHTSITKSTT